MLKRCTFKGGVHPPTEKSRTEHAPVEIFPPPEKIVIPLSQHIGAPAKPAVKRGDRVLMGQLIGEAGGFVSAPVHSSVSGTVLSIGLFSHPSGRQVISVEIENDGKNEPVAFTPIVKSWRDAAPQELVQRIQAAGIVGLGGAGFPAHVKLMPPSNKPIDTLIINGAECEPFLTTDHVLMIERINDLVEGALILRKILGAKKCLIGVESNKSDAIKKIAAFLNEKKLKDVTLHTLAVKYPQGGEKQLIKTLTGREVPSGGLPMDVGCVVQNVGTTVAISDAIVRGVPLYERVLTVSGPAIRNPKNLRVRIGTPVSCLLEACSIDLKAVRKIVMGGPMTGITLPDVNVPVIKTTSGILAFTSTSPGRSLWPCINCGHCVNVCPINLVPSRIAKLIEKRDFVAAAEWNVMDCIECGSCAYVCPAKINLVHLMKLGKYQVQVSRAKATEEKK